MTKHCLLCKKPYVGFTCKVCDQKPIVPGICRRCGHHQDSHSGHTYMKGHEKPEPNRCACCAHCPMFIGETL